MKKNLYNIIRYIQYPDLPFFLVLYRARSRRHGYSIMTCNFKNFRKLLRQRRGFPDPDLYGRTICKIYSNDALDMLKALLKERFDITLESDDDSLLVG